MDAYEKAESKSVDLALRHEFTVKEVAELRLALDACESRHAREKGGNAALRKFIELNHRPTAIRK